MEDRQIEELIWRFSESGDGRDLFEYLVQRTLEECGSEIDIFLGRSALRSRQMTAGSSATSGSRLSNTDVRMLQRRLRAISDQIANTEKFRSLKQKVLRDCQLTAQCITDRPDSSSLGFSTITEEDDTAVGAERSENPGQSTRFPQESEVVKAIGDLINLKLSDSTRLRAVRKVLSMSTFSIGKCSGIDFIFAEFQPLLANRSLTEEILAFSAKLFNSEDSEIVHRTFCVLMESRDAVPSEFTLKYCCLALQMFKVCPTIWKRCPSQNVSSMIDAAMKWIGNVADFGELSENNFLAVLAAMDPHAIWMRTWMHSFSYRRLMRAGMEPILEGIANFLSENTSARTKGNHFSGFYSTDELHTMLTISYSTISLVSLQYPDLYSSNLDLKQTVLEVLEGTIKRNFRVDRSSHVCKALTAVLNDVSAVQTSAEALRSIFPAIVNLRSVVNVRIVLNTLEYSEAPLDQSTMNHVVPMVNRYLNFKQTVVRDDVIRILDLALDKSSPAVAVALLAKDVLLKRAELSNPTHCSVIFRLGFSSPPLLSEALDSPSLWRLNTPLHPLSVLELRLFAKIVCTWLLDASSTLPPNVLILVCQPSLLVKVLNSSDFASFFDAHFQDALENRGSSFLNKLGLLNANLDFSVELRRNHNILQRIYQICSTKTFPFYDEATDASLCLLKAAVIGISKERKDLEWTEMPKKSADLIHLLYAVRNEEPTPEEFNSDRFYSNPMPYLLEMWKNERVPHSDVLKAMVLVYRQSSSTDTEATEELRPCGQDWTLLLDYAEFHLGFISTNRKAIRRIGQSLLVPYVCDDSDGTDWILGILFILAQFDRSLANDLSRLLSVNPNVSTLWPLFHNSSEYLGNVHAQILPSVIGILDSPEFSVVKNCLLAAKVSFAQVLCFYLNQAYLNILDWSGVADYVVLSLIGGAKFQAIHFCAVLMCAKDDLLKLVNSDDVLAFLLRPTVESNRLCELYEYVAEITERRQIAFHFT